jgi:hypothetical protein
MSSKTKEQPQFREVQYMRRPWLWALVLVGTGLALYAIVQLLLLEEPFTGNTAANVSSLMVGLVVGVAFPALMFVTHLITEVRSDALYYRYVPFHFTWQKIPLDRIKGHQATVYNPIRDYGGWGIRYWFKGKAYNVSGNRGVQLELTSGDRVLIGSQKPDGLAQAISAALPKA